ncbi:hypothetical protein LCGC14_0918330 [marine sediment metagenome]|uniref:Uncharacterized protein n=1 Tax=marine sediment metagenome TaxID=412755 RepID=A0A0F9RA75_9ZZZZ
MPEVKINQTPEGINFIEFCPVHQIYDQVRQAIVETQWMFKIRDVRRIVCENCLQLINQ